MEKRRSSIELSALIASELFEALEGARKPKPIDVSFDFDQTLSREDVQAYAKELIERGVNVWICTSRYRQERVEGFNNDIFKVAAKLGINPDMIVFTDAEEKGEYLEELWDGKVAILWHLDDCNHELNNIHDNCYTYPVDVKEKDWKAQCESFFKSKAVDRILHRLDDGHTEEFKAHIKDTVEDELADTVIRCLDALGFYWELAMNATPIYLATTCERLSLSKCNTKSILRCRKT